jgi:hypothetical protein
MSSLCLTCDDNLNKLPSNCVFTTQGDVQCYHNGQSPEDELLAAARTVSTAKPGTSPSAIYPVRGINDDGYYMYISELSGQPIQNRYTEAPPHADSVNACATCAASIHKDGPLNVPNTEHVKGVPEWGPHSSWLKKKDAHILNDPYYSQ